MIEEAEAMIERLERDDPLDCAYDPDFLSSVAGMMKHLVDGLKWRGIESAPMDGTPIIGAFWDAPWAESHLVGKIVKCWWQPEFEAFISSCREMRLAPGYTFKDGTSRQLHSPDVEPITHWLPLPTPPKGEGD